MVCCFYCLLWFSVVCDLFASFGVIVVFVVFFGVGVFSFCWRFAFFRMLGFAFLSGLDPCAYGCT